MKSVVVTLIAALILLAAVQGGEETQKHITLLAVSEQGDSLQGSVAHLYLTVKDGSGRVFIESQPVSKIDTQISTRFAKEVVCELFNGACQQNNFFYTIRADSVIVGGPSAGAAAALLTLAAIDDRTISESAAITGTINSGGLVGPVGGIIQKIEAAADKKIAMVLIPAGERFIDNNGVIIDATAYGRELGVEVREINDIYEAAAIILNQEYPRSQEEVEISPDYKGTMVRLADELCGRTERLAAETGSVAQAGNLSMRAEEAKKGGSQYSRASFCFGANIQYRYEQVRRQNYTEEELAELLRNAGNLTAKFAGQLPPYTTVTGLQSFMVVQERIGETKERLARSAALLSTGNSEPSLYEFAFATERLYSAEAWSTFLREQGTGDVDAVQLKASCEQKLSEAEERFQYAALFLPADSLEETQKTLQAARQEAQHLRNESCLFKASKAKAEANTLLSVLGAKRDQLNTTLQRKLQAAKESILRSTEQGEFPIVGYSYYEYATSLGNEDVYSALLFAEYALELSRLHYRTEDGRMLLDEPEAEEGQAPQPAITQTHLLFLATGIVIGLAAATVMRRRSAPRRRIIITRKRRKRKA